MNIVVCIKPVPDERYWDRLSLDPNTKTLRREGIPVIINPLDLNAIEEALRLKEATEGKVTVVSMGPPNTTEVLAWAYAYGVDDTVLLTDRAFSGADTLATARALAAGIKKIGNYDIIFLGNESIDGSTGQVGPQVAESLCNAHVTGVEKVELVSDDTLKVRSKIESGYMEIEVKTPVTLAVTKDINEVRVPPVFGALWATEKETTQWSADDVGADKATIGTEGSPTYIPDVANIEVQRKGEVLKGDSAEVARQLVEKLRAAGVLPEV
ncbi:electron transfer flavoprotein subunit beta/FixA family protein [Chloroflexota bacterium]